MYSKIRKHEWHICFYYMKLYEDGLVGYGISEKSARGELSLMLIEL